MLILINEFSKVSEFEINIQNQLYFHTIDRLVDTQAKNRKSFIITQKIKFT
jgi:hypothetical protein